MQCYVSVIHFKKLLFLSQKTSTSMLEVEDDFSDEEEEEEEEEVVRPKSIYDDEETVIKYQMAVAAHPSARDEFTTAEAARTAMANRAHDDLTTPASRFYVEDQQVKPEKPRRAWWEVWASRSPLYRYDYRPDPSEFANCDGIVPVVQNVDIMMSLGCSIDLTRVARKLPNCEYDPRRRSGAILRLRNPKATGTLFKSGNLRCMGARSEFLALCAARKFARKVARLGMCKIHFQKFRVTNVMATADVGFPLTSLGDFAAEFDGDGALYDTEIFCGVRYQLTDPKVPLATRSHLSPKARRHLYAILRSPCKFSFQARSPSSVLQTETLSTAHSATFTPGYSNIGQLLSHCLPPCRPLPLGLVRIP
jgi:TATA-box binding protein (TBP) (component of TFIID and TFIIIB)